MIEVSGVISEGKRVVIGRVNVETDAEGGATYVYVMEGKVHKTVPFANNVFIDVDEDGNVLGVEIL